MQSGTGQARKFDLHDRGHTGLAIIDPSARQKTTPEFATMIAQNPVPEAEFELIDSPRQSTI